MVEPMQVKKGERTRQRILDEVGPLFNARGYRATALADVMAATGLTKGGIYNHFGSKDDLVVAAYERNAGVQSGLIADAVRGASGAVEKLVALVGAFRSFAHEPPYPGGCPTLNTAVESANVDPRLHDLARQQMQSLLELAARLARTGVERGQLRGDTDPEALATVLAASLEGALLLHQLFGDVAHVDRVADHLERVVRSFAAEETA
jgi:TetR/AcrR family transcriptional repressor of nem operon